MREVRKVAAVTGDYDWFAFEGMWFELRGTCLEMGCMRGLKARVGAKCVRMSGINQGKGFDEEERAEEGAGDTAHDRGRDDDVRWIDVGRNQESESGPWAGMSLGNHLHTREQRWRLFVRPSRKQ
jgi:hypothetical protein